MASSFCGGAGSVCRAGVGRGLLEPRSARCAGALPATCRVSFGAVTLTGGGGAVFGVWFWAMTGARPANEAAKAAIATLLTANRNFLPEMVPAACREPVAAIDRDFAPMTPPLQF